MKNIYLLALMLTLAAGFLILQIFNTKNEIPVTEKKDKLELKNYPGDNFFFQRSFPDRTFDIDAYQQALEDVKLLAHSRSVAFEGFDAEWTTQGPGNAGARINAIAVHPGNDDIIYAGFSGGGIFKTTDGGTTWNPIFDDQPYLAIGDITLDPVNPDIVYAGTGDPKVTGYPFIGDGVYKSTDGGMTWQHLGLTEQRIVSKIIVDPTNSDIIYVSCLGLPFERNNDRGLYKSIDGGNTWSQILFVSDQAGIVDFLLNPNNPQIIYAASWDRIRNNMESIVSGPNAKIFKSTDGGNSWLQLTNGLPSGELGRIGLAMSGSNPDVIFAMYVNTGHQLHGIYKSIDGGQNWNAINTSSSTGLSTNALGGFGWYFGQLRVDPGNDNRLYLLGVNLWTTPNGGNSWSRAAPITGPNAPHVDNHDLVLINGDAYLGTDGGMYKRNQGTNLWVDIENIPATQFYRTAYNPHQINTYYGGTQDNGTQAGNAQTINDWDHLLGGDGFQVAFHPTDPDVMYAETQNGNIMMKLNAASGFFNATNGINFSDRRNWDMQYIMSSHNPNVLYTGTYRVYRSEEDGYPLWSTISGDLTDSIIYGNNFHTISTLAESPVNADFLYVGTTDGNVWRTLDGGTTWDSIHAGLPNRYVTSIIASPDSASHVFVGHSGYRSNDFIPHIHYSTDNGTTWQDISGDLPQLAINNIVVLPGYGNQVIFVATDGGVFGTLDGGGSWERLGSNFPYVPVYDIDWNVGKNELIAATFGRSLLTYPLDSIDFSQMPNLVPLAGMIKTENGENVDSVLVNLNGEVTDEMLANGNFDFEVPFGADCTLVPTKDINIRNGVTTIDIVNIQRHILFIEALDSPYKIIAADVNRSDAVTAFDLVNMRQVILFIADEFPDNDSWRFVPENYVFFDPENPLTEDPPHYLDLPNVTGNDMANFIGIKIGDVNGSANPNDFGLAEDRNFEDTLFLYTDDQQARKGSEVIIPFQTNLKENIIGFQFTIEFDADALRFEGFEKGILNNISEENFGFKYLDKGRITVSWNDIEPVEFPPHESLFALKFSALTDIKLSEAIAVSSSLTTKEAYNGYLQIMDIGFEIKNPDDKTTGSNPAIDIFPNPFSEETTLQFDVENETFAQVTIFDLKGETIHFIEKQLSKGQSQIQLEKTIFKESGVYFVQLNIGHEAPQTRKIIFLD